MAELDAERLVQAHRNLFMATGSGLFGGYVEALAAEYDRLALDAGTESQGLKAGLEEAKRRLSAAGMHDGKCPEPDEPCTCGLDAAVDGLVRG